MVPPTIRQQLSQLRWRERSLRLAWGAARWLALAAGLLAVCCLADWLIDRWRDTPAWLRVGMFVFQLVVWVGAALLFLVRGWSRRMSDSDLALWVESQAPDFDHRLITAVELNRPGANTEGMSSELIAVVTREAEQRSAAVRFTRLVDHRRLLWSLLLVLPLALGAGGLLASLPAVIVPLLQRQLFAFAEVPIPRSVELASVSRPVWPSGDEVVLRFHATGERLDEDTRGTVRIWPEGQPAESYPLVFESRDESGVASFTARVPPSSADFAFHAWLRDGRTRQPSWVLFEPRPAVARLEAWLLLPRYLGLRAGGRPYEQYQSKGDVAGLLGSSARIEVETQKPITRATLELFGEGAGGTEAMTRRVDLTIEQGGRKAAATFELRPDEDGYRVVLEDRHGFTNLNPPRRSLAMLPDEPPHIALLPERFPGEGQKSFLEDTEVDGMPVPLGRPVRLAYHSRAASGLDRAVLVYRVNEGEWQRLPLTEVKGSDEVGMFDFRTGAFERSGSKAQIEFHAVPSPDPEDVPGRLEGGGRFDFQTKGLSELKATDQIEFYVEVLDRNDLVPEAERKPGRSDVRLKRVVTDKEFRDWLVQTRQHEDRIKQLEQKQQSVFGPGSDR